MFLIYIYLFIYFYLSITIVNRLSALQLQQDLLTLKEWSKKWQKQ